MAGVSFAPSLREPLTPEGPMEDALGPLPPPPPLIRDITGLSDWKDTGESAEAEPEGSVAAAKTRETLETGALCMVWVIGLWVTVKLLKEFENELKPLVLAAMFVSILEKLVQTFECIFKKVGIFLRLLVEKIWTCCRLVLREMWHLLCKLMTKLCKREGQGGCCEWEPSRTRCSHADKLLKDLVDCRELVVPWHASFAGQSVFCRFPAVAVTLLLVAFPVVLMQWMLLDSASVMIEHLDGYRTQGIAIALYIRSQSNQISEHLTFLPEKIRDHVEQMVTEWMDSIKLDSILESIQSHVLDFLNGLLDYSKHFIVQLMFFLLYSFLWLFSPMRINPTTNIMAKVQRQLNKTSTRITMFHRVDSIKKMMEKSSPTAELQAHLYEIMWQYFLLKCTMNAIFGVAVWGLLGHIGVDLAGFIAVASFFLGFIPELGTIISVVLPIPLIVLAPPHLLFSGDEDHHAHWTTTVRPAQPVNPWPDLDLRVRVLFKALVGMIAIKLVVSNLLESWVMGRNKVLAGAVKKNQMDQIKETHPVFILFAVVVFGNIWGPIGMLISVPVISIIRLTLNVWTMEKHDE